MGGLDPALAAVEGHGPGRLDGREEPATSLGCGRGDRFQQPSGEPAALRARPDGEFVHLEGSAQPVVRPPGAEPRRGLRIAAVRREGRQSRPPRGEADHVTAGEGQRRREAGTPRVMDEAPGELGRPLLVLVPRRCSEGVRVDRAQRVGVGEDVPAAQHAYDGIRRSVHVTPPLSATISLLQLVCNEKPVLRQGASQASAVRRRTAPRGRCGRRRPGSPGGAGLGPGAGSPSTGALAVVRVEPLGHLQRRHVLRPAGHREVAVQRVRLDGGAVPPGDRAHHDGGVEDMVVAREVAGRYVVDAGFRQLLPVRVAKPGGGGVQGVRGDAALRTQCV